MGDETARRGVVDAHGGDDRRAKSGRLGPFCEAGDRDGIHIYTDGAVIRLDACGQGSTASGGIRHQGIARHRGNEIAHREMCKIDGLRSITGSLVILLGTHDLVDTHAVTDKIKHILNSGLGSAGDGYQCHQEELEESFHIHVSNWQIKIRNILYMGSTKTVLTNNSYKSNYHFLKSCAGLLCARRRCATLR